MFTIVALVLLFVAVIGIAAGVASFPRNKTRGVLFVVGGVVALFASFWFATHWIVPTQHVGVMRNSITQELTGPYQSGIASKPILATGYKFPAPTDYQRCEKYTPSIKGSYGITLDLCFYYDAGQIDWVREIERTSLLDADSIMNVWRNSVVSAVAESVKNYTPETLSDSREVVESALYKNVDPWFEARGIPLVALSYTDWDFTSPTVANAFDESIVSQRKIAEQEALYQAAQKSRTRETYEAQTSLLVAQKQREALDALGFTGSDAVNFLWIKLMTDAGKVPNTVILGADGNQVPATVPVGVGQ